MSIEQDRLITHCCSFSFYSRPQPPKVVLMSEIVGYIQLMFSSFLFVQTERDVSVRQRAVDLLYAMCDRSNAKQIVAEMLSYLETADYSIREEIVGHHYRPVQQLIPLCVASALNHLPVFLRSSRWPSWQKNML